MLLPEQISKEEIIYIRFVDETSDFLQIKTKNLLLFDVQLRFDIDEHSCKILKVTENCPLETRSVFKLTGNDKFMEIFESAKIFISDQYRNKGRVVLPDLNTKIFAGYNSKS